MTTKSDQLGAKNQDQRINFGYDALHRRVVRHDRNSDTITLFLFGGWNVVSEFIPLTKKSSTQIPNGLKRLVWGEDVSGSFQGAGGIGGLLGANLSTSRVDSWLWFHFDGNGNVSLTSNSDGKKYDQFKFDAFGNSIYAHDGAILKNPYQFSTKPNDPKSSLVYYGFRYLNTKLGRWLSRDPIGESDTTNLYVAMRNGCPGVSVNRSPIAPALDFERRVMR
ncbi:MAG: RHS repeat-associated core domain-containing protein [Verrucomicrobiaceae bacterium]|nr:RHS repeat-associated core domain-containing protein [Verrucomicrobiaceae bacterium]